MKVNVYLAAVALSFSSTMLSLGCDPSIERFPGLGQHVGLDPSPDEGRDTGRVPVVELFNQTKSKCPPLLAICDTLAAFPPPSPPPPPPPICSVQNPCFKPAP